MVMADKKKPRNPNSLIFRLLTNRFSSMTLAVVMAILFTCLLVWGMKANPFQVFGVIFRGSFGSGDAITQVIQAWIPLVLASLGLMFTFTAGLWNIGMEGQIEMGAIFAYGVIRIFTGTNTNGGLVLGVLYGRYSLDC
jgi:ABC-type uncharacterized transport system permease subunit